MSDGLIEILMGKADGGLLIWIAVSLEWVAKCLLRVNSSSALLFANLMRAVMQSKAHEEGYRSPLIVVDSSYGYA